MAFGAAAIALATAAWAALGLAAVGRFDARWALGLGAVGAAAFALACARAVRRRTLALRLGAADLAADAACVAVLALAVLRLGPAVPWPAALDGGWYAATAVRIAHDRSLSFDAPAAAIDGLAVPLAALRTVGLDAPVDRARGLHAVAFAVPELGVPLATPYHPPLFAAWAALGVAAEGPYGSATAAVWAAGLWLLAIAALARSLGLRRAAPAATALAAWTPQFRVYGATPYAELFAGALALAALVALGAILAGRRIERPKPDDEVAGEAAGNRDPDPSADGRAGFGRRWAMVDAATLLAAAAGAAAGSAVVAKVDLAPFALATAATWWLAAPRRRDRVAFAAGAALPCAALVALARGPTSVYAALNGYGVWRLAAAFGAHWGFMVLAGGVAVGAAWALRVRAVRGRSRRPSGSGRRHRPNASVPFRSTEVAGDDTGTGPREARMATKGALVGTLLVGAALWQARPGAPDPVGMLRLLTWSVTPLALFAAAIGLAAYLDTSTAAPLGAQRARADERPDVRRVVWPLLVASVFVLAAPIVTRDLSPLYAARRLAPIAVPTACLLAALGVERAVIGTASRQRAVGAGLAGVTLLAAALQAAKLRPAREFAAAQLLIDRIAHHVQPGDLALFPSAYGGDLTARLAAPLWALHDVDVAVLPPVAAGPETGQPGAPAAALDRWWAAHPGSRVLWVASPESALPAGLAVEALGDESLISEAWLPGVMPPALAPVELSVRIGVLTPAEHNSR